MPNLSVSDLKTDFIEDLIRANRLDRFGFRRLLFFPGMLFDRNETWWAGGGLRSFSHEGLDLCFFESDDLRTFRFDDTVRIPSAFSGRVVHIMNDFLGRTVVVQHFPDSVNVPPVYVFYAHTRPDKELAIGDPLTPGECFACIAPVIIKKIPLPSHLHLTIGRADRLPPVQTLSWPRLNRVDRDCFIDPLPVLDWPYRILTAAEKSVFHPCCE